MMSSGGSSSTDVVLSGLKSLTSGIDWPSARRCLQCTEQLRQGRYWQLGERRCAPLPGGLFSAASAATASHADIDELHCVDDRSHSFLADAPRAASAGTDNRWIRHAFQDPDLDPARVIGAVLFKRALATTFADGRAVLPEHLANTTPSDDNDAAPLLLPRAWAESYSRFIFFTSWLLTTYLPWRPNPSFANSTVSADGVIPNTYTAGHDANDTTDRIYKVRNVCVHAQHGLSGFFRAGYLKYSGSEDTRSFYHKMNIAFVLSRLAPRRVPPPFLDERVAILFPLVQNSRWNLAHTQHQVLSLIGFVLRIRELDQQQQHQQQHLDPLIIFAYEPHWDGNLERNHTAVLAFFIQAVGLPYAAIQSPFSGMGDKNERVERERLVDLYRRSGHATNGSAVLDKNSGGDAEVCFRRMFVWQNCYGPRCDLQGPESEVETYSFGQWVRPTPRRVAMVNALVRGMQRCVWGAGNSGGVVQPSATSSTTGLVLPRLFFDLRTGSLRAPFSKLRSIRSFPALADIVLEGVRGYTAPVDDGGVVFGEPWRSPRREYLRKIMGADIFCGVHGAAFSQTLFMQPGSVVLEYTLPHFMPHQMRPDSWFGYATRIRGHDHFFFEIQNTSVFDAARTSLLGSVNEWEDLPGKNGSNNDSSVLQAPDLRWSQHGIGLKDVFTLAPQFMIDSIRVAACRWMTKRSHGRDDAAVRRLCIDSSDIAAACQRLTSSSSSPSSTSCIQYRTLHYVVNDDTYAPFTVLDVLRSFFGVRGGAVSFEEASAIASRIRRGLQRVLRTLGAAKAKQRGGGGGGGGGGGDGFLEFEAAKHLRLQSSGAKSMTLLWALLVGHVGGEWDHAIDVTAISSPPAARRPPDPTPPDCCLVLDGVRRTCLFISAMNLGDV